jgi:hypothetical protein
MVPYLKAKTGDPGNDQEKMRPNEIVKRTVGKTVETA